MSNITRTISLTTRQVSKLADTEKHTINAEVRRKGHWRGVVPGRQANRRLVWPAVKVYQALGMLPPDGPRHDPATRLQQTLCARAPQLDPFHTHQAARELFATLPAGETPDAQHAAIWIDAGHVVTILDAFGSRAAAVMNHEDRFTADQIRHLNRAAEDIKRAAELACQPLNWRTPATATGGYQ